MTERHLPASVASPQLDDGSKPGEIPVLDPSGPPGGARPETDGRRPAPLGRVLALIEVLLCSGFPTQIALSLVLLAAGLAPYDDAGRLSAVYVVTLSLADTALILGLVWTFLRGSGESLSGVVLGRARRLREAALAFPLLLLIAAVALAVLIAVRAWAPWLHNVARNPFQDLIADRAGAVALGSTAVVAGGVREEVQRAFVLHRFGQCLGGGWLGLVLFSAAFGLGHAMQGWDVAVATGLMGAVWGAVYLVRRSAIAPMLSHALFNAGEVFRYTLYGL